MDLNFGNKKILRNHMRCLTEKLPDSSHEVVAAISKWLTQHAPSGTIATFAALPSEPDLRPLLMLHPEYRWVFPRVHGGDLQFYQVSSLASDLSIGAFGLAEPRLDLPEVEISNISVFLCPGLAFDPRGGRLGRGKGFYDRALAAASPRAIRIGIFFPAQRVADAFTEPHDISMHWLIDGETTTRVVV